MHILWPAGLRTASRNSRRASPRLWSTMRLELMRPPNKAAVVCSSFSGYLWKNRYSSKRLWIMQRNTSWSRWLLLAFMPFNLMISVSTVSESSAAYSCTSTKSESDAISNSSRCQGKGCSLGGYLLEVCVGFVLNVLREGGWRGWDTACGSCLHHQHLQLWVCAQRMMLELVHLAGNFWGPAQAVSLQDTEKYGEVLQRQVDSACRPQRRVPVCNLLPLQLARDKLDQSLHECRELLQVLR